jgi:23S rRNA pseudouridine1911/1915/1917 synthase
MDLVVPTDAPEQRLDLYLRSRCPDLSRSRIQSLIKAGEVLVNGEMPRQSYLVQPNDAIALEIPEPETLAAVAQDLPLSVVYEDADLLVVNKAPGMVVHPAPGAADGTLVNALLHHCRDLSGINGVLRPGIVHRLDKDTSGLLVVAKHDIAHRTLAERLQAREIERRYLALVWGVCREEGGRVEAPIDRNPKNRKNMAVVAGGRYAVTNFSIVERFPFTSLFECRLETGRTHQIRVHMAHIGHPVYGDPVYRGREQTAGIRPEYRRQAKVMLTLIKRQALHARFLRFEHPVTGEAMEFTAEMPEDMQAVVAGARAEEAVALLRGLDID